LYNIKRFFNGVGNVKTRIRNGKSTGIYSVQSVKDLLEVIIPHFEKYPLITQKQGDFLLFSLALNLFKDKKHLTEEGINKIISIRSSMNNGLTKSLKDIFTNLEVIQRPSNFNKSIQSIF